MPVIANTTIISNFAAVRQLDPLRIRFGKVFLSDYDVENRFFEHKYSCKFVEFKHKIEAMENEKHFEWEDDLMDWEFAVENLNVWQQRAAEVEHA